MVDDGVHEDRALGLRPSRDDERFMREALIEARRASELGEVPIGAVVVHEGRIIARAHNRRELDEDPSAHAEFSAMVEASNVLGRWRLTGCTVYVTLEPCLMCAGLMVNARIDRCVFGAHDPKGGAVGTLYDVSGDSRLNHAFAVTSGVLEDECVDVLRSFFQELRGRRGRGGAGAAECGADSSRAALARGLDETGDSGHMARCPRSSRMKVVVASDSFKGSASSFEVGSWLSEGIRRSLPEALVVPIPVADGGEGTVVALHASRGGDLRTCEVSDPSGDICSAMYLLSEDDAGCPYAVVEMAQAAGIGRSACTHAAALSASTRGLGELICRAVDDGARTVYVGLGGSATTDGGVGALQALGARVLDAAGREIPPGLHGLRSVATIDLAPAREALCEIRLVVLADVKSPLVGPRGAVRAFGAQKGLGRGVPEGDLDALFATCDKWMKAYGMRLTSARDALDGSSLQVGKDGSRPRSLLGVPGAGAAGGCGAALLALGAELVPGIDALLDLVGFDAVVRGARAVITGEGSIDAQTAEGKVPVGVARRSKSLNPDVPVFAVCGSRASGLDSVYGMGIDAVFPVLAGPQTLPEALDSAQTRLNLTMAGETIGRVISLL